MGAIMTIDLARIRVALVGGGGFIGHHVAISLRKARAQVHIIDDFGHNNIAIRRRFGISTVEDGIKESILRERLELFRTERIYLHNINASDTRSTLRVLDEIEPSVIVHLAGISSVELTDIDPQLAFDCGVRSLLNCLEWGSHRVERFIYLSSSMVYGNFLSPSVEEGHPRSPINLYGTLKLLGEQMVTSWSKETDLPFAIVRPSALYGPRCISGRIVEKLLTRAIQNAPLTIAGDGSERLDFTYIDDLVEGIGLCIQKPAALGQIFNLTFGQGRTILELVDAIRTHFPQAKVQHCSGNDKRPHRGTLCIQKAVDLLGYSPRFPLERGIEAYLAWMRINSASRECYRSRSAAV
jgi:nucleoside-diphosphate-sugar epimerase